MFDPDYMMNGRAEDLAAALAGKVAPQEHHLALAVQTGLREPVRSIGRKLLGHSDAPGIFARVARMAQDLGHGHITRVLYDLRERNPAIGSMMGVQERHAYRPMGFSASAPLSSVAVRG